MSLRTAQLLSYLLFALIAIAIASANPRPQHFGDNSQITADQDTGNIMDTSGLTALQLEILAQRLSDYNNQVPPLGASWERLIRAPEIKRQNRYRQCYFNPISCFKK